MMRFIYQNVKYFSWSKTNMLKFVTVKYSLHKSGKTMLH